MICSQNPKHWMRAKHDLLADYDLLEAEASRDLVEHLTDWCTGSFSRRFAIQFKEC